MKYFVLLVVPTALLDGLRMKAKLALDFSLKAYGKETKSLTRGILL